MKLPKAIRRHKGLAGAFLALLLLLCATAAVTLVNSGQSAQDPDVPAQEQQDEDETSEGDAAAKDDSSESDSPADMLASVDASRYSDDIRSYSSDARELQDLLNASVWMNGDSYAQFSDGAALVKNKSNQSAEALPFVLKAVEKSTASSDSSQSKTVYTAAVEVDGASGLMTCTRSYSNAVDFDLSATTITCSTLFGGTSAYTSQSAAQTFTVVGLSSDALTQLGGDSEKIRETLETWCRVQAPTANAATWDETLSIDYDAKVVRCPMELNNSSKTKVTVVYDMVGGLFSVKSGSN